MEKEGKGEKKMLIWFAVLIPIAVVLWGFLHKHDYCDFGEDFAKVFGSVLTVVALGVLVGCTISNHVGLVKLQNFYEYNSVNYEITIDKTASYLSQEQFLESAIIEGSIEKMEQAGYVSERLKEWRNAINDYNETIASMKFFDSTIWFGSLVPNDIQDMKPLIVQ